MGATPSQIENEVAEPDSESDDDEVIKIQHHRRYRVSLLTFLTYFRFNKHTNFATIWTNILCVHGIYLFPLCNHHFLTQYTLFCRGSLLLSAVQCFYWFFPRRVLLNDFILKLNIRLSIAYFWYTHFEIGNFVSCQLNLNLIKRYIAAVCKINRMLFWSYTRAIL